MAKEKIIEQNLDAVTGGRTFRSYKTTDEVIFDYEVGDVVEVYNNSLFGDLFDTTERGEIIAVRRAECHGRKGGCYCCAHYTVHFYKPGLEDREVNEGYIQGKVC